MVTALFNASIIPTNWTVVDGNRTWIACDEGSASTIAGWEQVRTGSHTQLSTWHVPHGVASTRFRCSDQSELAGTSIVYLAPPPRP